ncbi:MAG: type VI secretion system tip protein VgrG [Bryobacterales bacterium]|nr:type VI secretion system tip protein VgrG [Bryobacterales bacterium]
MGQYKQEERVLQLATALGPDILLAQSFSCAERISGLYSVHVWACAEEADAGSITAQALIGQRAFVRVKSKDDKYRHFHGIVRRFTHVGRDDTFQFYRLELVPLAWRMSQVTNCRIFQDLSVPDIVAKLLGDYGVKLQNKVSLPHKPWDYCVQYRESDFAFISRLMEQEGIHYFFEHGEDQETFVFADGPSVNAPCPNGANVIYRPFMHAEEERENVVTGWEAAQELRPGLFSMRDHNFQKHDSLFHVSEPSANTIGGADKLEIYDYPGEFAQLFSKPDERIGEIQPEGESTVKRRMQAEETETKIFSGESIWRHLAAGFKFTLEEHLKGDYNAEYVLTSVQHQGVQAPGYRSDTQAPIPYQNSFRAIPAATPYVPARTTPKPVVQGPQTAVVTGPSGEELHLDKYGRVRIQFFWDREGTFDEKSTCWVRVAQSVAGKKWGSVFHPRIGQEVVVAFLEGDPDQPLIIGSVYNASSMHPYTLPDFSTMSTFKSDSSKGGGGFNEFRFEDKKGDEHIFLHAERNHHTRVKKDSFRLVDENDHLIINKDHKAKIGGDSHTTVSGDEQRKAANFLLKTDQELHGKAGTAMGLEGGTTVHLKGGMKVIVEAGMQVSLKAGGSFVDIGPAGVAIKGPLILLNSGGAAGSGDGIKAAAPAAPEEPLNADPGEPPPTLSQGPPVPARTFSPQAAVLASAAQSGAPFCDI